MYRKEATAAAGKICSLSCACGADCGLEHRRLIPLLNSNFTCPLRKYILRTGNPRSRSLPVGTGLWRRTSSISARTAGTERWKFPMAVKPWSALMRGNAWTAL